LSTSGESVVATLGKQLDAKPKPGSTMRQTGKTQQLERPISQQSVILFDSNFIDQYIKTLEILLF
jgi:hypothetical protein